jgi:hypothetical protein
MSKELRERTFCRVLDWKVPRVECHSLENKPDIEKEKLGLSSNKFYLPVSTASLNALCTSNSGGWSYIFSFHLKSSHNQIQSSVTPGFFATCDHILCLLSCQREKLLVMRIIWVMWHSPWQKHPRREPSVPGISLDSAVSQASNFLLDSSCLHSTSSDLMNWEVYVGKLLTWWMVPGLHELHMQWLPFSSSTELPGKSKSESRTRSEMQWDCPFQTTGCGIDEVYLVHVSILSH